MEKGRHHEPSGFSSGMFQFKILLVTRFIGSSFGICLIFLSTWSTTKVKKPQAASSKGGE